MSHETLLTVFVMVSAIAMALQLVTLAALAISITKSTAKFEAIAEDFQRKLDPLLISAREIAVDTGPKVKEITSNVLDVSSSLRLQAERLDGTVREVLGEVVTQVNRASQFVDETLETAEKTKHTVEDKVVKPVRTANALIHAVGVGLAVFFGHDNHREKREENIRGENRKDEMFI